MVRLLHRQNSTSKFSEQFLQLAKATEFLQWDEGRGNSTNINCFEMPETVHYPFNITLDNILPVFTEAFSRD